MVSLTFRILSIEDAPHTYAQRIVHLRPVADENHPVMSYPLAVQTGDASLLALFVPGETVTLTIDKAGGGS